jgi:hypothetical protein
LPNVTGVGFGYKESGGRLTATAAWRVYVRQKVARRKLACDAVAPASIQGLPTDVVPAYTGAPTTGGFAMEEPIGPGAIISNLKGLQSEGEPSGLGSLGFIAAINGIRKREVVLVSNRHVLLSHGARRGDPIYRPVFCSSGDSYVIRSNQLDPIAEVLDEGAEANHSFQYLDEPAREYFVDCATARLIAGSRWNNTIARRVGRVHPLDVIGGRLARVRKVGGTSGAVHGRVVDALAPVESGGVRHQGNLVIRSSGSVSIQPGDSGALLVNDRDEAIGILWGRNDRNPAIAYACHIHPVLDRLGVTMLNGGLAQL